MIKRQPTGDNDREMIMATLSVGLENHDGSIKALAGNIGLSASTLYNVQNQKTQWPRPATLFGLARALNLRISIGRRT
jgi:transcriptional regulator with XRE-family HTH domain